ncbi:beta-glucosidase [Halomicrobium katesii]|uniref:beta-glucosidase n=1 Tax=Halomicrobium katesii TaxID=437163 RepID=UPI0003784114|nr:glycoside hydrolase family 3 C-terminal domain-containing protein [Halomicrobium katesii]
MSDREHPPTHTIELSDRVATLVDDLTAEEKLSLVRGAVDPEGNATGYLPGVERLDVPELRLADGPLGVRTEEPATAFPASTALASTFDPGLARRQGESMGVEAAARDQDVLLAPGLNLIRVPQCGRTFEYYSEDPILTGAFAGAAVAGIQSAGVVATPKHYVANSQETRRASVSAAVDERVLRELYLPGFRDAVDAGARSVMTAYNRVNGTYMSEHRHLLAEVLKGEWGFEGFVVSDWFGTESARRAANAGLDVEMPGVSLEEQFASMGMEPEAVADEMDPDIAEGMPDTGAGGHFADDLLDAVDAGDVPEARLDDMVARVLSAIEWAGLLDSADAPSDATGDARGGDATDEPDHRELARTIATRGTVLLKNESVLPLADDASVAVVGPNVDEAILGGGGSSETTPFDETSPVEGITDRADGEVTVARGLPPVESVSMFDGMLGGDDADTEAADEPEPDIDAAVAAASEADAAVVFVRDAATEAADRDTIALPGQQDALVERVAAVNDDTIVVLNTSGPVELPWREDVAAVVSQWYPGQSHGESIAAVLYGDADPGGRLPVTLAPEDAYPADTATQFPGVDDVAEYSEGLLVGYRHFDATDAEPTYPFGHGHSYATFAYEEFAVEGETATVTVTNESERAGREVVQAYVDAPDAPDDLERPPRELAAFEAVEISGGETVTIELTLDDRALGRYDAADGWTIDDGRFTVAVGRSSRDLRLSADIER